jgi:glutathione S-transferase
MLKFYFAPGTCALASRITLEEAGADYEPVRLDFSKTQQRSPDYLKVNPKGRVPALVTDRGTLTETPAILAYIAQTYPRANLAPVDDAFEFARVQSINSYFCSTVHVAHAHRMRGYRWADEPAAIEAMQKKVPQSVGESFQLIENEILMGPWVMGGKFTICDPYLFTLSGWMKADSVDINSFPKVHAHRLLMLERPAVQKALVDEPR